MYDDERFRPVYAPEGVGGGEGGDSGADAGDGQADGGGQDGGEGGEAWHGGLGLDDDTSKWLDDKGYAGPADVVKAARELERWQGRAIELPGADATPEQWGRIYNRLGRPETADAYQVDFGEGVDAAEKASVLSTLHGLGLTQRQVEGLHRFQTERMAKAQDSVLAAARQAIDTDFRRLDAEWGADKDRNDEIARRAVKALGIEANELDALGDAMKSHAGLWRAMHKLGAKLGEDKAVGRADNRLELSTSQATAKIGSIRADSAHPYNDERHPAHKAAVAEMQDLHKVAYPEQAA